MPAIYALYLWIAPDARPTPQITFNDLTKIAPVASCAAGAHLSSIVSMNLGAVSFAQIVKCARKKREEASFTGLALGCIEADFCARRFVGNISPRSAQYSVRQRSVTQISMFFVEN